MEAAERVRAGVPGDGADSETGRRKTSVWGDGVVSGERGQRGGIVLRKVLSNAL